MRRNYTLIGTTDRDYEGRSQGRAITDGETRTISAAARQRVIFAKPVERRFARLELFRRAGHCLIRRRDFFPAASGGPLLPREYVINVPIFGAYIGARRCSISSAARSPPILQAVGVDAGTDRGAARSKSLRPGPTVRRCRGGISPADGFEPRWRGCRCSTVPGARAGAGAMFATTAPGRGSCSGQCDVGRRLGPGFRPRSVRPRGRLPDGAGMGGWRLRTSFWRRTQARTSPRQGPGWPCSSPTWRESTWARVPADVRPFRGGRIRVL